MVELVAVLYKTIMSENNKTRKPTFGCFVYDRRDLAHNIVECSDAANFENLVDCCRKVRGIEDQLPDEVQTISGIINLRKSKGYAHDETRIPLDSIQLNYFNEAYRKAIGKKK
jgi:hypothetical protein